MTVAARPSRDRTQIKVSEISPERVRLAMVGISTGAPTGSVYGTVSTVPSTGFDPLEFNPLIGGADAGLANRTIGTVDVWSQLAQAPLAGLREDWISNQEPRSWLFGDLADQLEYLLFRIRPTPITIGSAWGEPEPRGYVRGAHSRRLSTQAPPAYMAFKAIGTWLTVDDATVARIVDIGRTTPYTWERDGREPRPATVQRLYEYFATLDSLRRRLGPDGFSRWLFEDSQRRRETLLEGRLDDLERDVHDVLFKGDAALRIDLAASEDAAGPATPEIVLGADTPQPSGRRPRRRSA